MKIDYKLSRFLDPQMQQPGPMLKNLLGCHPDIVNNRTLDTRSDIWSLGKVFVEILSSDPAICGYTAKIEELPLPTEIENLLKVMLADDPDIRPRSMAEVADILAKVTDKDIKAAKLSSYASIPAPVKEVRGMRRWMRAFAVLTVAIIIAGGLGLYYYGYKKKDPESILLNLPINMPARWPLL